MQVSVDENTNSIIDDNFSHKWERQNFEHAPVVEPDFSRIGTRALCTCRPRSDRTYIGVVAFEGGKYNLIRQSRIASIDAKLTVDNKINISSVCDYGRSIAR